MVNIVLNIPTKLLFIYFYTKIVPIFSFCIQKENALKKKIVKIINIREETNFLKIILGNVVVL